MVQTFEEIMLRDVLQFFIMEKDEDPNTCMYTNWRVYDHLCSQLKKLTHSESERIMELVLLINKPLNDYDVMYSLLQHVFDNKAEINCGRIIVLLGFFRQYLQNSEESIQQKEAICDKFTKAFMAQEVGEYVSSNGGWFEINLDKRTKFPPCLENKLLSLGFIAGLVVFTAFFL